MQQRVVVVVCVFRAHTYADVTSHNENKSRHNDDALMMMAMCSLACRLRDELDQSQTHYECVCVSIGCEWAR